MNKKYEKMRQAKFADTYNMPWEQIEKELEAFDSRVLDMELNETNYSKYRRGWLLRAELAYSEVNNDLD